MERTTQNNHTLVYYDYALKTFGNVAMKKLCVYCSIHNMPQDRRQKGGQARFFLHENAKRPIAKVEKSVMQRYMGGSKARLFKGGSSFGTYLMPNEDLLTAPNDMLPWLYVKPLKDLDNQEAIDILWSNRYTKVPCISGEDKMGKKSKCGKYGTKILVNKKDPAEPGRRIRGQILKWNKAWMLVFDTAKCRENDKEFFELVKKICLPTFEYHCKGSAGLVNRDYINKQFETATHMMLLISDCIVPEPGQIKSESMTARKQQPKQQPKQAKRRPLDNNNSVAEEQQRMTLRPRRQLGGDDDCSYIVMGFVFLDADIASSTSAITKTHQHYIPKPIADADTSVVNSNNPSTSRYLYTDIICSRLGMGTRMMGEILKGKNSPWMEVVFGSRNVEYFAFLRAISSVYTYYPFVFGYQRTTDNKNFFPIFEVDITQIRRRQIVVPSAKRDPKAPPLDKSLFDDNQLMTKMFGASTKANTNEVVWEQAPEEPGKYYVYRIEPECKDLFNHESNNFLAAENLEKRIEYFSNQIMFEGDSDEDGYIFGKYVE